MRSLSFQSLIEHPANTSISTAAVDLNQIFRISGHIVATATINGEIKFQVSNDFCPFGNIAANFIPTNWSDLGYVMPVMAAGSTQRLSTQEVSYRWLRVVWTDLSGGTSTGTISFNIYGLSS